MGVFQKIVEWGTDAKYVPVGKKCDICGENLTLLETGFWSVNAKQLADGVLCKHCFEKLERLRECRELWVPQKRMNTHPFCYLDGNRLLLMDVQNVKLLLESAESLAREELSTIGPEYRSLFRMAGASFIEPTALQVGVQRAKLLNGKLVLFGFVQLGQFEKGDRVLLLDGKNRREATVLEVYAYDCEENTLEVNLKAHVGKQQLASWEKGWLILDDIGTTRRHTVVVGKNNI